MEHVPLFRLIQYLGEKTEQFDSVVWALTLVSDALCRLQTVIIAASTAAMNRKGLSALAGDDG
jgi:hypothetical protein